MKRLIKRKLKEIKENLKSEIIKYVLPNGFYFSQKGYCPCCDLEVIFQSKNSWLRDYFICSNCKSIPRERALMVVIEKYYPNWRNLDIHESSPGNRGASLKLKKYSKNYLATQYYPNKEFGAIIDNFQNEDLENQTFNDSSFDLVISQDVMEHVYNPEKAFAEIARTLRKGGAHIFTLPIINKHMKTEIWAVKGENGEPIFTNKPEWHSNVVDINGSPVTMHWGFDIVDFINKKSGLKTIIEHIDNLDYGIRGELIEVLVSVK